MGTLGKVNQTFGGIMGRIKPQSKERAFTVNKEQRINKGNKGRGMMYRKRKR